MNWRLTATSAAAVILASFSLFTVIMGVDWLYGAVGAAIVVAAAGTVTRLARVPATIAAAVLVLVAVVPLLAGPSWAARIAGLVLVALVAGSAGVRRVLPVLAGACTYLAALFIYLNLVFASARSAALIVPTRASVSHLAHLASLGYAEHAYAPPVPGMPGINLIAAAGIGAAAIVTDLLAVRLRSPAVAGLPLLVLFSVPVASNVKHEGVGLTVAFCFGIAGYLTLLAADGRQRLRLWGRLVTAWQDDGPDETARGPDTRQLAASGRRIGLAAVALAVVVPLVVPQLRAKGLFDSGAGLGHGGGQAPVLHPLVQMHSELVERTPEPVLTYRTTAGDPPEQYLQMYVLNYDPASLQWKLASRASYTAVGTQPLRAAPGLSAGIGVTTSRTTVTISKSGSARPLSYLPLPYAPEYLKVPGKGWVETNSTLMVYGYRPDAGLSYKVTSQTAAPSQVQLSSTAKIPASVSQAYGTYLGPDRSKLLRIARAVVRGAHTKIAEALALENWFTAPGRFTYSLTGNLPSGRDAVYDFLTTDRRGFCQQFAFAMAVLARLLGIPSRIAVGYTAGTYDARRRLWRVTTADAHAWPELYFANVGWVRFEPTPGGSTAQGTATKPVYPTTIPSAAPSGPAAAPTGGITPSAPGATPSAVPKGRLRAPTPAGTAGGGAGGGSSGGFPVGLVVALAIALVVITPGLTRALTRRRRWLTAAGDAGRAHTAWRELTSDLADLGLSRARSESPRAVGRRIADLAGLDGPARQALSRVTSAEERARYARTPGPADALRGDVQTVRRALARNSSRGQRLRARLLPASTLAPVLAALRQVPDLFGWLDAAGLRARRMVASRLPPRRAG